MYARPLWDEFLSIEFILASQMWSRLLYAYLMPNASKKILQFTLKLQRRQCSMMHLRNQGRCFRQCADHSFRQTHVSVSKYEHDWWTVTHSSLPLRHFRDTPSLSDTFTAVTGLIAYYLAILHTFRCCFSHAGSRRRSRSQSSSCCM